ncbi:MAG: hypothetical protein RR949_01735 [Oscillospiraceae bacterium]
MKKGNLDSFEIVRRKAWLLGLAQACANPETTWRDAPEEVRAAFALSEISGMQVYESFTDEELLDLLRSAAHRLGHSPSQKEIFWVYRSYIKQRFVKWPYALRQAGLSKAAGSGGLSTDQVVQARQQKEELLRKVRDKAAELGRTPHPKDLPEVCVALCKQFATWGELLTAAGLEHVQISVLLEDLEPEHLAMLEELRALALKLGRPPLRMEAPEALRTALIQRCGSWRNTLFQIGLEPVIHMVPFSGTLLTGNRDGKRRAHRSELADCYYQVLNPSPKTRAALDEIQALAQKLGRPPRRGDVPAELRKILQTACGSWRNALFQLGLQPERQEMPLRKIKFRR